jgi:hypothetical protein
MLVRGVLCEEEQLLAVRCALTHDDPSPRLVHVSCKSHESQESRRAADILIARGSEGGIRQRALGHYLKVSESSKTTMA